MSLSIVTTNVLVDPATYASRAGALRAAKREGLAEYKIEQCDGGRFMVMVPQAEVIALSAFETERPAEIAQAVTDTVAESVSPATIKAVRAPKAPKPAKQKAVTKKAQVEAMLRAALRTAASMATELKVSETAIVSLVADVRRAGVAVTAAKVEGETKVAYKIEA